MIGFSDFIVQHPAAVVNKNYREKKWLQKSDSLRIVIFAKYGLSEARTDWLKCEYQI